MRTSIKVKDKPHPALVKTGTNSVRLTALPPSRADAQRMNLKRAYQAFMRALPASGKSMADAPSVAWPNRPYAASV